MMNQRTGTVGSILDSVAPRSEWDDIPSWPPDVFGITALLLNATEAFLFVVSPPAGRHWPPTPGWAEAVQEAGRRWAAGPPAASSAPPDPVLANWRVLTQARDLPLDALSRGERWDVCVAALTLHALADEAGAGLGSHGRHPDGSFESRAWKRLRETGSLARLPLDRVKVVPKTHLSPGGINLRSLSRHLASYTSPVNVSWGRAPRAGEDPEGRGPATHSILLLPWPLVVRSGDFRPVDGPLLEMDPDGFGFFQFDPREPLDLSYVETALRSALKETAQVDLVLLPEAAVRPDELERLEELVGRYGVLSLTTGVREPAQSATSLGRNYAHMGIQVGGRWQRVQVDKHHRWGLDPGQIRQYRLSRSLSARRLWWEAICIPRRSLHILDMEGVGPVAVLICEDLARLDAVAEVLRFVGPTLVMALLLDGPQLSSRWSSRYAGVLADDPGSAVLTLTSLGMAQRSRPSGRLPSRVIALWKDPDRGQREIEMARGALGVLLTLGEETSRSWTADGRCHRDGAPRLVLENVTQILSPRAAAVPPTGGRTTRGASTDGAIPQSLARGVPRRRSSPRDPRVAARTGG